jgi:hypothetical protein
MAVIAKLNLRRCTRAFSAREGKGFVAAIPEVFFKVSFPQAHATPVRDADNLRIRNASI